MSHGIRCISWLCRALMMSYSRKAGIFQSVSKAIDTHKHGYLMPLYYVVLIKYAKFYALFYKLGKLIQNTEKILRVVISICYLKGFKIHWKIHAPFCVFYAKNLEKLTDFILISVSIFPICNFVVNAHSPTLLKWMNLCQRITVLGNLMFCIKLYL